MYSPPIQKLIDIFSKFPTVGPRTAARFVFYLIKLPQDKFEDLLQSIKEIRRAIKLCPSCFNPYDSSDSSSGLCLICKDRLRDCSLLCVVEKEEDLNSIEKTKKYKGLYFVLGGTINLRKNKEGIRIEELKKRIEKNPPQEIIIATNPTTEGEATAFLLERELKPFNIKTTRLGRGLPVGGELEYADSDTLESALETRK